MNWLNSPIVENAWVYRLAFYAWAAYGWCCLVKYVTDTAKDK